MSKKLLHNSRFLSYVLRHQPEKIGISLEDDGWVSVDELLEKSKAENVYLTKDELDFIVENNDKKRFTFNEDKSKIRAAQGHTTKVKMDYKQEVPPVILYHGTVDEAMNSIRRNGLDKQARHHVHLSKDKDTAIKVGSRRGKAIILQIDAKAMYADGYKFYKSDNGVWLTDAVPVKYITQLAG